MRRSMWRSSRSTGWSCCHLQVLQCAGDVHLVGRTVHTTVRKRLHVQESCSSAKESKLERPAPTFNTGKNPSLPPSPPSSVAATRRRISQRISSLMSSIRIWSISRLLLLPLVEGEARDRVAVTIPQDSCHCECNGSKSEDNTVTYVLACFKCDAMMADSVPVLYV